MVRFGANVTQTAVKGLNLAQTGNYDHVLNLKYTCRALPSCYCFKIDYFQSLPVLLLNAPYWVVPWYQV